MRSKQKDEIFMNIIAIFAGLCYNTVKLHEKSTNSIILTAYLAGICKTGRDDFRQPAVLLS